MTTSTRAGVPKDTRSAHREGVLPILVVFVVTLLGGCNNGPFDVQTRALPAATEVRPNDREYTEGNQWYLDLVSAPAAWGLYLASAEDYLVGRQRFTIPVAVIDSGIDGGHVDLVGSIATSGVDVVGAGITPIPNGLPADFEGIDHGTHVAGLITARAGNGRGIAGIASDSSGRLVHQPALVVPVRALTGLNGTLSDLIEALLHVVTPLGGAGLPPGSPIARVINMSLGAENSAFGEADVLLLEDAVQVATDRGLIVVAAAGNGGDDGIGRSDGIDVPARFPAVIAVGSVDRPDASGEIVRSRFSDYGPDLELVAPGAESSGWDGRPLEGIVSTWPGDRYSRLPGTSMASPLVAGGAALVWSANPGLTAAELRRILQETAVDLGDPGRDEEFGYGLLDLEAALRVALTTPWGPFEGSSLPADPAPPDVATRSVLRRSLSATIAAVEAGGDGAGGDAAESAPGTTSAGSDGVLPALLVYAAPGTTVAILEAALRPVDESLAVAPLGVLPNGPLFRVTEIIQPTGSTGKDPSRDRERLRRVIEALAGEPAVLTVAVDRPIVLR